LRKERENGKERKVEYLDKFPVSGKIPKTPERPKNKITWKASQKFSKIINIIKIFLVESVFRNSMSFLK